MTDNTITHFGAFVAREICGFGRFTDFATVTIQRIVTHPVKCFRWRLLGPQLYAVGVLSIPVVAITGAFIGMILALEGMLFRCEDHTTRSRIRPRKTPASLSGPLRKKTNGGRPVVNQRPAACRMISSNEIAGRKPVSLSSFAMEGRRRRISSKPGP